MIHQSTPKHPPLARMNHSLEVQRTLDAPLRQKNFINGDSLKTYVVEFVADVILDKYNLCKERTVLTNLEIIEIIEDAVLLGFEVSKMKLSDVL